MTVAAERDILTHGTEMCLAVRANREVGVVTGVMAFRIFQSMLLSVRVEMRPRRLEVGGVALRVLMKVDGMFAGGQILEIEFHPYSRSGFPQNRGAHNLALGVLELNQNLGRTRRCERDHEQSEREQASGFHGEIITRGSALRATPVWRRMRRNVTIGKCKDLSLQPYYWPRG